MPRKEDGMFFEVHPAPLKDKLGRNYIYVRPYGLQRVSQDELDTHCASHYSVPPGEMKRVLGIFMQAVAGWLADGRRVETPFGSFAPKIGLHSEKTTADRVAGTDVELQGIEFTPTRRFVELVAESVNGFRPIDNPDTQQLAADTAHLDRALGRCMAESGYATVKSFMRHSGLRYHSARRQLDSWCEGDCPRLLCTRLGGTRVYTET
ncbi:MAG: hypothetical protein K5928_07150 [Prevotella sp.]|nr:hypothetical protein [Prevotella sp.]